MFKKLLALLFALPFCITLSHANVNLTVSPIKYEIDASAGETITRSAKLINLSNKTFQITTGTSDFSSKDHSGTPIFTRKHTGQSQELSSWITISQPSFSIGPKEEKDIDFTVQVPTNATPGGHYGAVFFQNRKDNTNSGQIGVNTEYGVLILVKVDGDVIVDGYIDDPSVETGGGIIETSDDKSPGGGGYSNSKLLDSIRDKCVIDLTASNFDGKCYDTLVDSSPEENNDEKLTIDIGSGSTENNKENLDFTDLVENIDDFLDQDFKISFTVPFENKGNTHLKPVGKITLVDEEGNTIKNIGKKIIQNEHGVVIGEEIVNYIPINDQKGNVLPGQKMDLKSQWLGFPYESYNVEGKKEIKYWTPNQYYTQQNISKNTILMPWERVNERINTKKITANFNVQYGEDLGEPVEFNSAKEFDITYKEEYISINPYFVIGASLFGIIIGIFWLIAFFKKRRCINKKCRKRIKKDMKVCPYCGTEQKKKKKTKKKKK